MALTWKTEKRNGSRILRVVWRELNGPAVTPPKQTGFGSTLIDDGIPNATVKREFGASGVVCTIELPLPSAKHEGAV